jgi:DNA-binding FadR family transcriptional regulator
MPSDGAAAKSVPVWRPVRGRNAGERLPAERELAERLQVGRLTLRGAIRAFREAGYLESRRAGPAGRSSSPTLASRAGAVVDIAVPPKSDPTELAREMGGALHDALDFRRVIEPGAAGLAARRTLSSAERQHLVACLTASRDRDPTTRRVADSRLHLAIAAASGSPSLASSIADVQLTLDRLLAAIPVLRKNLDHSDAQHTRIVEAILAGDAAGARAAMEEHCDGTADLLRGLLA